MPDRKTLERARKDKREGKSPSTQAGEFVHEEIKHIREGKHGARSTKQAIAIGLSKARRAGVSLTRCQSLVWAATTREQPRAWPRRSASFTKPLTPASTFSTPAWEYHEGESEKRRGKAIADRRDAIFLMTKICPHGRNVKVLMRQLTALVQLRRSCRWYIDCTRPRAGSGQRATAAKGCQNV